MGISPSEVLRVNILREDNAAIAHCEGSRFLHPADPVQPRRLEPNVFLLESPEVRLGLRQFACHDLEYLRRNAKA